MDSKRRAKIKRLLDRAADLIVQADDLAAESGWPDRQTMIMHVGSGPACRMFLYESREAQDSIERFKGDPSKVIHSKMFKGIDVGAA